jgi:protoporphyrin/coproporphyrin ferrochelatase
VETRFDSVLFVAFGGPTPGCCRRLVPCPGSEALCFVQSIVGSRAVTETRVAEVAAHYQQLGGFSPFNALTIQQATAVEQLLHERGVHLPVYVGMRHWPPYVKDVLRHMANQGLHNILAVIMAPHQCFASWDWYQQTVADGIGALGNRTLHVTYLDPWYTQAGYVVAIVDQLRRAYQILGPDRAARAALMYTAHSIPAAMADKAPYVAQFAATATAATQLLGHHGHTLAYQSQVTGTPGAWLQPDINDAIRHAHAAGYRDVIVAPIGFLCDHVEILYDLDIAAKKTATACDMTFVRAKTVGNHPAFLAMLRDLLVARLLKG